MKKTKLIAQVISLVMLLQSAVLGWDPPVGIRRPEFGIDETHMMYQDQLFDYDQDGTPEAPYKDAGNGPYTHYVYCVDANNDLVADNVCSDSNVGGYGDENNPRCTLPLNLPAGSVVEVHGDAAFTYLAISALTINGTREKPVFIRGASTTNKPIFKIKQGIRTDDARYFIIENIHLAGDDNTTIRITNYAGGATTYGAVRNIEASGSQSLTGGGAGIMVENCENIVLYANNIHDYGVHYNDTGKCGVSVGSYAKNIWIVDNQLHDNAGDGVHVSHQGNFTSDHIYIGRNDIYNNFEDGVDIKEASDVIVSENKVHDHSANPVPYGGGVVAHYDPPRIWVLNNEIFNNNKAVGASSGTVSLYIIGNKIYNIAHEAVAFWQCGDIYVIGNTITDVADPTPGMDRAISGETSKSITVCNNIVANLKSANALHLGVWYSTMADASVAENNLFYQNGGPIRIIWGQPEYNSVIAFQQTTGKGAGCIEVDPEFIDPANNDFQLQPTSPAIDAGAFSGPVQQVFDTFQQLYGIDIRKDINRGVRPYGAEWDIGAYEWGSTPADPNQEPEPDPEPEQEAEPEALMPDVTALLVMNNIIKSGGNQSALIRCDMKEPGKLTVKIYDVKGKEIITVCDEQRQAGRHEFVWTGQDSSGSTVGSGIYMVHCEALSYTETKKVAVIK